MSSRNATNDRLSMPEVNIVTSRCSQSGRLFGIRFEKMAETWVGTWTFAVSEDRASREGYNRSEIRGAFAFGEKYPGCPHCESVSLFKCKCGKVDCWDRVAKEVQCAWCHARGTIEGKVDRLSGGGDR